MTREYFHQRHSSPARPRLDLDNFRRTTRELLQSFDDRGFLQRAFGYHCVDEGQTAGAEGTSLASYLLCEALLRTADPVADHLDSFSEIELLGLHEALWNVVAAPKDGWYHPWNNCGWHYRTFDRQAGQIELVEKANKYLRWVGPGYQLTPNGEVQLLLDDPAASILEEDLPPSAEKVVRERVDRAVATFRRGKSTWEQREAAVRDLGDVMELLRQEVRSRLSRADESDLFEILNRFGIRHLNDRQKMEYDRPVFLKWLFYVMLAAIHACLQLREREIGGDAG